MVVLSKGRIESQDKPRFKKRVSNKFPSKFPKSRKDMVSNPKTKKGSDTSSSTKKPTCGKCGKKYYGDCLKGLDNFSGSGKKGTRLGIAEI